MGYDYRRFKVADELHIHKVYYVNTEPNDEEIVCYSEERVDVMEFREDHKELSLLADAHSKPIIEIGKIIFYDPR